MPKKVKDEFLPRELDSSNQRYINWLNEHGEKLAKGLIFSSDELEIAQRSENDFFSFIQKVVSHSPHVFFLNIEVFEPMFSSNKMQDLLMIMGRLQPWTFINNYKRLLKFFPKEKRSAILSQIFDFSLQVSDERNPYFLIKLDFFLDPEIENHLGESRTFQITESIINSEAFGDRLSKIKKNTLIQLEKKKILTLDKVRSLILEKIKITGTMNWIKAADEHYDLFDDSQREVIKSFAKKTIQTTDLVTSCLESTKNIFSQEEKLEILKEACINNPDDLLLFGLESVIQQLPKENVIGLIEKGIERHSKSIFIEGYNSSVSIVMSLDFIPTNLKKKLISVVLQHYPSQAITDLPLYLGYTPDSEKLHIVRGLLENSSARFVILEINSWIEFIPLNERRAILIKIIKDTHDFTFIEKYSQTLILQDYFSRNDIINLTRFQLSHFQQASPLREFDHLKSIVLDEIQLKNIVKQCFRDAPTDSLTFIKKINYLFTTDQLKSIVEEIGSSDQSDSLVKRAIDWMPLFSVESRIQILIKSLENSSRTLPFFQNLDQVKKHLSLEQFEQFSQHLILVSPGYAVYYQDKLHIFYQKKGIKSIKEILKDHQFSPNSKDPLAEFLLEYDKEKKPRSKELFAKNFGEYYEKIRFSEKNGFSEILLKLTNQIKNKKQVVNTIYCLALGQEMGLLSKRHQELIYSTESIEDLNEVIFEVLSELLDLKQGNVTSHIIEVFIEEMGDISSLFIHIAKHHSRKEWQEIFSEIFLAISNRSYIEWKFGNTQEDFEEMKENGWLPEKLSYQQYQVWQKQYKVDVVDTLDTQPQRVVQEIRSIISDNLHHLGIEREHLTKSSLVFRRERKIEIAELINKAQSKEQKHDLFLEIKKLAYQDQIYALYNLSIKEVINGFFISKSESKGQKLDSKFFSRITRDLSEIEGDGDFVIERIRLILQNYQSQTDTAELMECFDSSEARDWITLGSDPVITCQHFANGQYSSTLVGLTDPSQKTLIAQFKKGSRLSRTNMSLLSDESGGGAIFTDTIYSSMASSAIDKLNITTAFNKAEEMGINLYTAVPLKVKGFSFIHTQTRLFSRGGRAPEIYIDANKLGRQRMCVYSIANVYQVVRDN